MDTISISWHIPGGEKGIDDSPNNPISRALNNLFSTGQPFTDLVMCFFIGRDGVKRWLGIFVKTVAGRICFFPGYDNELIHLQAYQGKNKQYDDEFIFDHITLERDRLSWHVTQDSLRQPHQGGPKTTNLGNNLVLWTGMSISHESVMREAKSETVVTFDTPQSDAKRRSEVFMRAREGKTFPVLVLQEEHFSEIEEPSFMHFGIIVGRRKFNVYTGGNIGNPYNSPFCKDVPLPLMEEIKCYTNQFGLADDTEFQLTTCILKGRIETPILFSN